jgi:hypothetical protein
MELKPLISLAEKRNAVLVAPMPRYIKHSCCDDRKHVTNWSDASFIPTTMAALSEVK